MVGCCVCGGEAAWQEGGVRGRGACMAGVCVAGGHAWWGVCVAGGMCDGGGMHGRGGMRGGGGGACVADTTRYGQ